MITLEASGLIEGDASAATKIDYLISGVEEASNIVAVKELADGQLANTKGTLYTVPANTETIIKSIILVNTDSNARTVNLYYKESGGTSRRIIPQDVSLNANGGCLILTSAGLQVFTVAGAVIQSITGSPGLSEPTGFLNRADSDLSFVSGTRTFTIAPSNGSFDYYIAGVKYTVGASEDIIIADTSGIHIIYYDGSTLSKSLNPNTAAVDDMILNKVLVATIYWNATDGAAYLLADERHGLVMSGMTHLWLHRVNGTAFKSGFTLSGQTEDTASDAALTFELTDGKFYDEDLEHSIDDGDPANQYKQQLNGGDAAIPIVYKDDIDGSWKQDAATTLPYKSLGAGRLAYNKNDLDTTFSQVEVADGKWVSMTLIATNDWQYPIKAIQGQNEYTDKKTAVEEATAEIVSFGGGSLSPEVHILYRFVMQTKDTFGGTKKAKIEVGGVTDFRTATLLSGAPSAVDHGALSGLADNDHAQYILHSLADATELTISAGGVITVTQMVHTVDTAGDAGTDNLDTINGGATFSLIILRPEHTDRTVVVRHGQGNIELQGGADISLDDITDHMMLFWDTTNSKWVDFGGGDAGMSDLVDDLTPQLGGDLDLNGKNIDFPSVANVSDCKDEDNMASDSATMLATQQSIKAYVDARNAICDGRLTLTSGEPENSTTVTAATTLYYTPYIGNKIALYNGSQWKAFTFTERSLSLSGYTANKNYDIWLYDNSGTLTLESTIWTNDTTRATALVRQDGVLCKTGALTRRFLGTIRITGVTGQTENSYTKSFISNYYHRRVRHMAVTATGAHTYATATWREWNGAGNGPFVYWVSCDPEFIHFYISLEVTVDGDDTNWGWLAFGRDSTSSGTTPAVRNKNAQYIRVGTVRPKNFATGYHYLTIVEYGATGYNSDVAVVLAAPVQ